MEDLNNILPECFASCKEYDCDTDHDECREGDECKRDGYYNTPKARRQVRELIVKGAVLTEDMINRYQYLDDNKFYTKKLLKLLKECEGEIKKNNCDGHWFKNDDNLCVKCNQVIDDKIDCKHYWAPMGGKNRDRIHNRGNGKGTYMCYKCTECGKFKRRYIK